MLETLTLAGILTLAVVSNPELAEQADEVIIIEDDEASKSNDDGVVIKASDESESDDQVIVVEDDDEDVVIIDDSSDSASNEDVIIIGDDSRLTPDSLPVSLSPARTSRVITIHMSGLRRSWWSSTLQPNSSSSQWLR